MKIKLLAYIIINMLLISSSTFSQTYTCTIQNQVANGADFTFDIYIQRTDATEIYLANSEFSLTFADANFSDQVIHSHTNATELDWYDTGVDIPSPGVVKFSVGSLLFQSDQSKFDSRVFKPSTIAPGSKLTTVTIGLITNTSGFANLQWKLAAPHDSKVNNYLNEDPWTQTNITSGGTYTNPFDAPVPVELISFSVNSVEDTKAQLEWETTTEVNNYGFDIERKSSSNDWGKLGFVEGHGNSNSPKHYSFEDNNIVGGSDFTYRLKQIDFDGTFEYSDELELEMLPLQNKLFQNYPNPFNPTTKIKFSLVEPEKVSIKIYNTLGEIVYAAASRTYDAGFHEMEFNGTNLVSGIYFYEIQINDYYDTKKMILVK